MPTSTQLWRVTIAAPTASAEALGAALEEDSLALTIMNPPRHALCEVEAIFAAEPSRADILAKIAAVATMYGFAIPDCLIEPVPQEDWLRKVALASPPRQIGRLLVYGRHDAGTIPHHVASLHIDAATAFGTGEHPSTQMCLLLLQEWLRSHRPRRVLDIGCGSGILALATARLARSKALAIDNDAESARMARENARLNGLEKYVKVLHGNGYQARQVHQSHPYDLIFANIFARPLMQMANDLHRHLAPGGAAILAGLLQHQAAMVQSAHRMQRLHLLHRIDMGEWSGLLMVRRR